MSRWVHTAVVGFFSAVVVAIVFVKAGQRTGVSGGQQTAQILNAGGSALANAARGLEG
ncbi:MAG TPA: hypothetical protein VFD49_09175 [Candidatus Dormibacteraeota bacterium]|nr:hypothetical protein [Candidatus Dormibacteraeota bacterium]